MLVVNGIINKENIENWNGCSRFGIYKSCQCHIVGHVASWQTEELGGKQEDGSQGRVV
jgi:hypothetical protein